MSVDLRLNDTKKRGIDALLLWCKKQTKDNQITISDFSSSWKDGTALCSLLNKLYPNSVDLNQIDNSNAIKNINMALDAGRKNGLSLTLQNEDFFEEDFDILPHLLKIYQFYSTNSSEKKKRRSRRTQSLLKRIEQLEETNERLKYEATYAKGLS
eukprot:TRINITY_DN445_c0_g1_i2.p1 TRINITY_DN445_c0_g1~~TRINITY_DN445_c0_g1_i2.p1  ORF type:complete len:155 (+),score=42.88 TRINITY_DN445_c0_g1_i2:42-506(+)